MPAAPSTAGAGRGNGGGGDDGVDDCAGMRDGGGGDEGEGYGDSSGRLSAGKW